MFDRTEELNYFNDPRVRAKADGGRTFTVFLVDGEGYETEVALPTCFVVCPTCEGTGKHVNPSIDAGGYDPDDRYYDDEDPYLSGVYDVRCYGCSGKNVVAEVDESRCTAEQLAALRATREAAAEMRAEKYAEIRAGC